MFLFQAMTFECLRFFTSLSLSVFLNIVFLGCCFPKWQFRNGILPNIFSATGFFECWKYRGTEIARTCGDWINGWLPLNERQREKRKDYLVSSNFRNCCIWGPRFSLSLYLTKMFLSYWTNLVLSALNKFFAAFNEFILIKYCSTLTIRENNRQNVSNKTNLRNISKKEINTYN